MTTSTIPHLKVQRSRFLQHVWAALAGAMPGLAAMLTPARVAEPSATAPRDAAREAADVRRMAESYIQTDRGFAADLYAAADRHERLKL